MTNALAPAELRGNMACVRVPTDVVAAMRSADKELRAMAEAEGQQARSADAKLLQVRRAGGV
jgi:hypothetical protein